MSVSIARFSTSILDSYTAFRVIGILWAVTVFGCNYSFAATLSQNKSPLTVAASIETTRILSASTIRDTRSPQGWAPVDIVVSPDGRNYVAILIRGDLERNGNWAELITGSLESLENARHVKTVTKLFSKSFGGFRKNPITHPGYNRLAWIDNSQVAFLWDDERDIAQVYSVNLLTRSLTQLTHHDTNVESFDIFSQHGAMTVVYAALDDPTRQQSLDRLRQGFAVENDDAFSLLMNRVGSVPWGAYERYISSTNEEKPWKVVMPSSSIQRAKPRLMKLSPDGGYAIIDGPPADVPVEWDKYSDPDIKVLVSLARQPERRQASQLSQVFIIDVKRRSARPLFNAPRTLASDSILWAPDSRTVVMAPAFLPVDDADDRGLVGEAVVEVDVESGSYISLAIPESSGRVFPVSWRHNGEIELQSIKGERMRYRKINAQWRQEEYQGAYDEVNNWAAPVNVEVRQGLNEPPRLFAVENGSHRERMILDLNPKLKKEFLLGRVEIVNWTDPDKRVWTGRLYYPVKFRSDRRYPLVLQTHGMAPATEFSLYGVGHPGGVPGLGPGISIYAAQVLAGKGIAVLQIEDKNESWVGTSTEPEIYAHSYEAAIKHLSDLGLIDSTRVGISGYSATGYHVEFALTQTSFPYAAALVSDNMDSSYVQAVLTGLSGAGIDGEYAIYNKAPGYGPGLQSWLSRAPGFNAHKVRTPLRLQVEIGTWGILGPWEMFNALRVLKKPVEFYVIPYIERGTHTIQNPEQCLASQQGAVDWFDFWLNGHENAASTDADQYIRWRRLRDYQKQEIATLSSQSSIGR